MAVFFFFFFFFFCWGGGEGWELVNGGNYTQLLVRSDTIVFIRFLQLLLQTARGRSLTCGGSTDKI